MSKANDVKNWPAASVAMRKRSELIAYAGNSRTHSDQQIDQLVKSLEQFGWTAPILIDEHSTVIAGHGRLMAADKLGLEQIPCTVATGWTEAQRRAFTILDNRLAENAGWDQTVMIAELAAIGMEEFDLQGLGITAEEMVAAFSPGDGGAGFLKDYEGGGGAPAEIPLPQAAKGDVALTFHVLAEERDLIVDYLHRVRDKFGYETAARALVEIARTP